MQSPATIPEGEPGSVKDVLARLDSSSSEDCKFIVSCTSEPEGRSILLDLGSSVDLDCVRSKLLYSPTSAFLSELGTALLSTVVILAAVAADKSTRCPSELLTRRRKMAELVVGCAVGSLKPERATEEMDILATKDWKEVSAKQTQSDQESLDYHRVMTIDRAIDRAAALDRAKEAFGPLSLKLQKLSQRNREGRSQPKRTTALRQSNSAVLSSTVANNDSMSLPQTGYHLDSGSNFPSHQNPHVVLPIPTPVKVENPDSAYCWPHIDDSQSFSGHDPLFPDPVTVNQSYGTYDTVQPSAAPHDWGMDHTGFPHPGLHLPYPYQSTSYPPYPSHADSTYRS